MKLYEMILNNRNSTKTVPISEYGENGAANWERFHKALWNWRATNGDEDLSECYEASKAVLAPINENLDMGRRIKCASVDDLVYFRELAIVKRKEDMERAAHLKEVIHYCKARLGMLWKNDVDSVEFNATCTYAGYIPTEEERKTITLASDKIKDILTDAERDMKDLRKAKEARREYITMSTVEGFRLSAENLIADMISDALMLSADDIENAKKHARKRKRPAGKTKRYAVPLSRLNVTRRRRKRQKPLKRETLKRLRKQNKQHKKIARLNRRAFSCLNCKH